MEDELLTWFGNALNFVILFLLTVSLINTACFNISQIIVSAFGLIVSILIHWRNLIKN